MACLHCCPALPGVTVLLSLSCPVVPGMTVLLSRCCPARSCLQRMAAMEAVRSFKVRLIVSTDIMARGVDFDRVNLVVNVDLPPDPATYVHRYMDSFRQLQSLSGFPAAACMFCICACLQLYTQPPAVTCTASYCCAMPECAMSAAVLCPCCVCAGWGAQGALAAGALLWRC